MIKILKFKEGQEKEISNLIHKVYNEYIAPEYSNDGNNFFYKWISPAAILTRQKAQINIFVASIDEKIVGIIEIRDNHHISLLFVDKVYQRQGIAKKLLDQAIIICSRRDPSFSEMTVNASPYSIPIYQKMGFIGIGEMQEEHGIKFLPMKKEIT